MRREGLKGREGREGLAMEAGGRGRPPLPRYAEIKAKGGRGRRGKFKHVESDAMKGSDSGRRCSVVALAKRRDIQSRRGA